MMGKHSWFVLAMSLLCFAALVRRACADSCPDYQVTLYASGRVEYLGKGYVCETGPRTSVVDANAAARLIADLRDGGLFESPWISNDDFTDAAVVLMKLSIGGRQEWIRDNHGDWSAPDLPRRFEQQIDYVAATYQWDCPDGRKVGD